jgi:hypothetical protein
MVAESNRVRRLRRHFGLPRRGRLALVVAGVAATVFAAPMVANAGVLGEAIGTITGVDSPAPRTAAAAAPVPDSDATVELSLAPTVGTTFDPAAPVTVDVEIDNRTGEPLAAGTVRLFRPAAPIADQSALDAWFGAADADDRDRPRTEPVAELAARALPAGATEVVSFTLPAGSLGETGDAPVAGLGAELVIDGTSTRMTTGAVPLTTATGDGPRLAMAYAISVPAEATGLIDAEALELWTGPSGLLTRQLDAIAGRPVAVALDPRLVASIRALGTSAPTSSVAWLDRLASIPNEIFPLQYADADPAVQAQLGLEPIAPESFADVLDPADFVDEPIGPNGANGGGGAGDAQVQRADGDDDEAASAADPVETEQPVEPTAPAGDVPTTQQLLAWPYTRTDLAWPADATVAAGDLAVFEDAGYTTTILDAANVEPGAIDANAASTVEGASAVVADARISAALREAAGARSDIAWGDAASRLGAELAVRAAGGDDAVLLATFQRGAETQSARVAALFDAMAGWSWSTPVNLSEAVGAAPVDRMLVDLPETAERQAAVRRLFESETAVQQFATVLEDPKLITAPVRRELLALLDVAWLSQPAEWATAVGEQLADQTETIHAVSIAQSSPINVLSSETGVPTTIENLLPYPVTVFVDVAPSNGRLIVEERVETTVAADSRSNVIVPVAAGVGNGEVRLSVSLWSPEDVKVGQTVQIAANVQADWEGLGAGLLGVVAVAFFGIGIWRNIRRRRRERAAADAADAAGTADVADVGGSQYPAQDDERNDVDDAQVEEPRRDG